MKEIIERIEKELELQEKTKANGVLIDVEDLNAIGYGIDPNKTGKAYVDPVYLKIRIDRLKFKDNLKVETPRKEETFKDVEKDIKRIETKKIDESWDSISK